MKLTIDQVEHIAKLAALSLTSEEVEKFQSQLSGIITYVEKLNSIDTENVLPTYQVTDLVNIFAEDRIRSSLPQDVALANAKSKKDGFFKVKAVLDH